MGLSLAASSFILAQTETVVEYDFDDFDLIADEVGSGVVATEVGTGSASLEIFQNGSLATAFVSGATGLDNVYTTGTSALAAGQTFTFGISASAGGVLELDTLSFTLDAASNGAANYAVFVEVDSSGTLILLGNASNNSNGTFSESLSSLGEVSTLNVEIALFNSGSSDSNSATQLDNVLVTRATGLPSDGGPLVEFDFNDFDLVADQLSTGIEASQIGTGTPELTIFQNGSLPTAFVSGGTGLSDIHTSGASALAAGQTFTFEVSAVSGNSIAFEDLSFTLSRASNGARNYAVYLDPDSSGTFSLLGSASNPINGTFSESLGNLGEVNSLQVQIALFNKTGDDSGSATQLDNVVLTGRVNVLSPDADNDGLTDDEENTIYNTNPNVADSDSDGVLDGAEIVYGSDPNNSASTSGLTELSGVTSPGTISSFLNGVLPVGTPATNVGAPNWQSERAFPNLVFSEAMVIHPVPESDDLLVAQRTGEFFVVDYVAANPVKTPFGDISDRVKATGLGGMMEVEFHPEFNQPGSPNRNYLYVFYTTTATSANGFTNPDDSLFFRVSRFTRDETLGAIDPDSEVVMIQQLFFDTGGFDGGFVHLGSGMTFGNDGFLYLAFGDTDDSNNKGPNYRDAQRIDQVFQCAMLALDVDQQGGTVSSAPVRSLQGNTGPNALSGTSQSCGPSHRWFHADNHSGIGYLIPRSNYWHRDNHVPPAGAGDTATVGGVTITYSAHGAALEEHVAHGLRNGFSMVTDPVTGAIAIYNVGSNNTDRSQNSEQVHLFEPGANYGWPFIENGILQTPETRITRPPGGNSLAPSFVGNETGALYAYSHRPDTGRSTLGGMFYNGSKYPTLAGTLIGGDFTSGRVYSIDFEGGGTPEVDSLLSAGRGMRDMAPSPDGEDVLWVDAARVFRLVNQTDFIPEPPATLSATQAFSNLNDLVPVDGFIEYLPTAPLWSDRASKPRFMAVPNSGGVAGAYDLTSEKITFSPTGSYSFPIGTVFIKNFILPTDEGDESNPLKQHKVETRFQVKGADSQNYYFSYRWREDQSDADLIMEGDTSSLDQDVLITRTDGTTYTQTWEYPTRNQCFDCHQVASGEALGFKTSQLNMPFSYPTGITANQLTTFDELKIFDTDLEISALTNFLKSSYINDESVDLEQRVRSYLDSNCSNCHQPDAAAGRALFDARLLTSLAESQIINGAIEAGSFTLNDARIVKPGDVANSLLHFRDISNDPEIRMPPVGRAIVDEDYINVLERWINRIGNTEFDQWAVVNGVVGGLSDDQDGDGQVEFFEYLGRSDPNNGASTGVNLAAAGVVTDPDNPAEVTGVLFSWVVRDTAVIGEDYGLQLSDDLVTFETMVAGIDYTMQPTEPAGEGLSRITILVNDDNPRCFLRLQSL